MTARTAKPAPPARSRAPAAARPPAAVIPLDPDCAMVRALELIANKWTVPIIFVLSSARGTVRFRELQRRLGAITQKELTRHLRRLERVGLVSRTLFPEVPPRVEYQLTALGATLETPLGALARWAFEHSAAMEANEQAYAERASAASVLPP